MSPSTFKNKILIGEAYASTLIEALENAKREINIIMYVWQDYPDDPFNDVSRITHLILSAHRKNLNVRIITNFNEVRNRLSVLGLNVKTLVDKNIVHAKMVTVDRSLAFVGSHNFSRSSLTSNVEISQKITDTEDIEKLNKYFETLWQS
jgi:phosphatidylserine/phosphatidylglycerophosphate/cardiolipin synthase-like enzyme